MEDYFLFFLIKSGCCYAHLVRGKGQALNSPVRMNFNHSNSGWAHWCQAQPLFQKPISPVLKPI